MEYSFEFATGSLTWPPDITGTVIVALAALSTAAFLFRGTVERISSLVALFLGATLFVLGVQPAIIAVLLLASSILLAFRDMMMLRQHLTSMRGDLDSMASAVRNLEIAEERRQMIASQQPLSSAMRTAKQLNETGGVAPLRADKSAS